MPFNRLAQYDSKRGATELIKTLDSWLKIPGVFVFFRSGPKMIARRPEEKVGKANEKGVLSGSR